MYKNLEYLLRVKKINGAEISKELGITGSAFSQFRNQKAQLNKENLKKLAKLLNSTVEEILDEEDLVIKNVIIVKQFQNLLNNMFNKEEDFLKFVNNENNYIITTVDKENLKSLNILRSFSDVISFIYNQNSMSTSIKDRDLVYVDILDKSLVDGVYLINEDGILKIRRLKKDPTKATIFIKSDNEDDIDWKEYNLLPDRLRELVYGKVLLCFRNIL